MNPATARRRMDLPAGDAVLDVIQEGQGPAVVLLPSSLRDSLDFDPLAQALAQAGFAVLRPQPRGMGRSSPPPPGMTLATLAADVAHVIAQLAEGPAVVVGHAYGHWVARVTDHLHPAQVRGVVALGAGARVFPAGVGDALATASDPALPREDRLAALRWAMFAPGNDPSPWLEGWYPQWRSAYRAAAQTPPPALWWDHSHAPLLDLQGAQDRWRPEATRDDLRRVLGARVTVRQIDQAGHALVPEQPLAIAQAVSEWAQQIGHR